MERTCAPHTVLPAAPLLNSTQVLQPARNNTAAALPPLAQQLPFYSCAVPSRCRLIKGSLALGLDASVLSIVTGTHTHYLAAANEEDARRWIRNIRHAWIQCVKHPDRATRLTRSNFPSRAAELMADNNRLKASLTEMNLSMHETRQQLATCVELLPLPHSPATSTNLLVASNCRVYLQHHLHRLSCRSKFVSFLVALHVDFVNAHFLSWPEAKMLFNLQSL